MVMEALPTPVVGIWDEDEKELFAKYRVTMQFTGRVMGGVPQKPEIIEAWLRQRVTSGDDEVRLMMARTLEDLGVDTAEGASMEDLYAAARKIATEQHSNTFRRDENGLFLSAYNFKAAVKENIAILYPYQMRKMGPTNKAARAFVAERLFVDEARVYLKHQAPDGDLVPIHEADGMHLQVGHITGPKGPRSTLTYYDYVDQPFVSLTLSSLEDMVPADMWKEMFLAMQRNGVGALRSMSYGQFKVTSFEQLSALKKRRSTKA